MEVAVCHRGGTFL